MYITLSTDLWSICIAPPDNVECNIYKFNEDKDDSLIKIVAYQWPVRRHTYQDIVSPVGSGGVARPLNTRWQPFCFLFSVCSLTTFHFPWKIKKQHAVVHSLSVAKCIKFKFIVIFFLNKTHKARKNLKSKQGHLQFTFAKKIK